MKLKSNLKTTFLPLALITVYAALANQNIPELGDIIFCQSLIVTLYGLALKLINFEPSILLIIKITTILLNSNFTSSIFTTYTLQESNFTRDSLDDNLYHLNHNESYSDSTKSSLAISAEKQKTSIDRMQEENRLLLTRLTDLENVFKSTTHLTGRSNMTTRHEIDHKDDDDYYYGDYAKPVRKRKPRRAATAVSDVNKKSDRKPRRRKSLFSVSSGSTNCSSVFSVAHSSNDRVDTDITDYGTYDIHGKNVENDGANSNSLDNSKNIDYSDDSDCIVANEKLESENKEYWMNRIVKMLEEEDPRKSYNLKHITAGYVFIMITSRERINLNNFKVILLIIIFLSIFSGNGKIYKAKRINLHNSNKNNDKSYAIKSISLSTSKLLNVTYAELMCSRILKHPNVIVHYKQCILNNNRDYDEYEFYSRRKTDQNNNHHDDDDNDDCNNSSLICSNNTLFLIMEFCNGGSLWDIRNRKPNKRFDEMEIAFVIRETLKGLEYIHDMGIIHRDVKAQNILVDDDGKVKIG